MEKLRSIVLGCGLNEELKWGKPCYTWEGKNIVVIQGFKDYCALLFIKGYLVSDPSGILVKTGPNTRVGRQARFVDVKEVGRVAAALKGCVRSAVDVEVVGGKKEVGGKKVGVKGGKVVAKGGRKVGVKGGRKVVGKGGVKKAAGATGRGKKAAAAVRSGGRKKVAKG